MPELPDITIYQDALRERLRDALVREIVVVTPFVLRSVSPPLSDFVDAPVFGVERLGKRVVLAFAGDRFLVIHLMIAGRLQWAPLGKKPMARAAMARFEFSTGSLVLTEAGTTRRASLTAVVGREALRAMERGGLDVFASTDAALIARLRSENHTLKRALTDPRLLDGIGNAYSDEILHAARLSPLLLTQRMSDEAAGQLITAVRSTLTMWTDRLRTELNGDWPVRVTAFRPEMAVHGRYGAPCPVCGTPVQRIRYAQNETNYCARCQTGGRLLADRAMSRLLKSDWPRSLDDL